MSVCVNRRLIRRLRLQSRHARELCECAHELQVRLRFQVEGSSERKKDVWSSNDFKE